MRNQAIIIERDSIVSQSVMRGRSDKTEPKRHVSQPKDDKMKVKDYEASISKILLNGFGSNDETVLDGAMQQLVRLLCDLDDDRRKKKQEAFCNIDGPLKIVVTMLDYPDCKFLQTSGIAVLIRSTHKNEELATVVAKKMKGIPAVLAAMKSFSRDATIQYCGLKALIIMSTAVSNAKYLVAKLDGVPFIFEKMDQHSVGVTALACELLTNLCSFEQLRKPIYKANAVTAVALVIDGHQDNPSVQEIAWKAMEALKGAPATPKDALKVAAGITK